MRFGDFPLEPWVAKEFGEGNDGLQQVSLPSTTPDALLTFTLFAGIAIIGQSGLQHAPDSAAWGHAAEANNGSTPMKSTTTLATILVMYLIRNLIIFEAARDGL